MKGTEYRRLVSEQAEITGDDPTEAYDKFVETVRRIRFHREEGQLLQKELVDLGRWFAFYRKGELPEEMKSGEFTEKDIPSEDDVRVRYRGLKKRQRAANRSVVILTRVANKLLGGDHIQIPRGNAKGGAPDGR